MLTIYLCEFHLEGSRLGVFFVAKINGLIQRIYGLVNFNYVNRPQLKCINVEITALIFYWF